MLQCLTIRIIFPINQKIIIGVDINRKTVRITIDKLDEQNICIIADHKYPRRNIDAVTDRTILVDIIRLSINANPTVKLGICDLNKTFIFIDGINRERIASRKTTK
jgi:hypothetical protein